jgi:8-oxo-dGTP pyrophosphatase MutT (NUDIX family)
LSKRRSAIIPKKPSEAETPTRVQYGALPYRLDDGVSVEVLLVTSRETKRWIIPKGWPIKGLKPSKAAAREAYEEAGVRGRIAGRAFGHCVYEKRLEDSVTTVPCQVQVFPLAVKRQSKDWPESKQRAARWFPAAEAAALVDNDRLHDLIRQLEKRKASSHRK